LRPYDHAPRVTRNPAYAEIKASIRERGLDAPPALPRRPGEAHYIIRNGGNTRLAILRELWSETKEERVFRIACLFRPWPARGEIVALTGHLAENELRGGLTFIERALGIEKAREFYEQEIGQALSQIVTNDLGVVDVFRTPTPEGATVYRISTNVQRFESAPGKYALLDAVWSVRQVGSPKVLTCRTVASETVSDGNEALVAGHRRAVARLGADIATAVRGLAANGSAACPASASQS